MKEFITIVACFILIAGCIERNLDAFEEGAGFYSVYGALDADSTLNYIRIRNTQVPVIEGNKDFDADVTFEDVEVGENITLRDTVVDFSGFITHSLILDRELPAKKAYRLTVNRDDGISVSSLVTIPDFTEVQVAPSENVRCDQQIEFIYNNVEYPEQILMEVGVRVSSDIQWGQIGGQFNELIHRLNEDQVYLQTTPLRLVIAVFPPSTSNISCNDVNVLHIRYRHLSKEWEIIDEVGRFPADHSQWQDVENGSGFLGAFREDKYIITLRN